MKKVSMLMGAAAVMMMTACSSEEVINVAENNAAIGFSSFVDNSTRATDKTLDNLEDMAVYGTTKFAAGNISVVFNKQQVLKNGVGANELWSYSPLQYWIDGNSYSFAAIAPFNAVGVEVAQNTTADKAMNQAGLTITFDNEAAKGDEDILYAFKEVGANAFNTVDFTLGHMLSRVNFKFENVFASDLYYIRVKDVTIKDATAKASIDKTAGEMLWTAKGTDTFERTFAFSNSAESSNVNSNGDVATDTHYIIPLVDKKLHNVSFSVQLCMKDADDAEVLVGDVQNFSVSIPEMNFVNGYSYTFVASIDEKNINTDPKNPVVKDPIQFTVTSVNGYVDANEDEDTSNDYNEDISPKAE